MRNHKWKTEPKNITLCPPTIRLIELMARQSKDTNMSEMVEAAIWDSPTVQAWAKSRNIQRPTRVGMGRPPKQKPK